MKASRIIGEKRPHRFGASLVNRAKEVLLDVII